MARHLSEKEILEIQSDPSNKVIDFDRINEIQIPRTDITNSKLLGHAGTRHSFGKGNIVNSEVDHLSCENVNFEYVDFKDCIVRDSSFVGCNFDFGAIINNVFQNCTYEKSHFHNMSITDSQFSGVTFVNCNLKNMVIKGCKFVDCTFLNCKTSNKLIEFSSILNCKFENTDIQIQTITDNFGVHKDQLIDSQIRSGRLKDKHFLLDEDSIKGSISSSKSSFDKFKLEYFLNNDLLVVGSNGIDELFIIENWLELCRIPSTFVDYLELFLEFILYEYESDNAIFLVPLKFHEMTASLIDNVSLPSSLYSSVMGVHMTLSRLTEDFLLLLYDTMIKVKKPDLRLQVLGPLDHSYYFDQFEHFFLADELQIKEVRKLNSPNMLHLIWENMDTLVGIVSLLYATRIKLEIRKVRQTKPLNLYPNKILPSKNSQGQIQKANTADELQVFNFEAGLSSKDERFLYGLKFRSIMPGSLMADLRLTFSTKLISKLRKTLVSVIDDSSDSDLAA